MAMLTNEAAVEDANKWFISFGQLFREVYFRLAEPFRDSLFPLYLEDAKPEEIFQRVLATINLYPHPNIAPLEDIPVFDTLKYLKYVLIEMYNYTRGEDISDLSRIDITLTHYCIATRNLASFKFLPTELETDKVLESLISPRFAQALKMFRARITIESALNLTRKDIRTHMDPTTLAILGGVAYTYIIKLIKTGKLSAWKEKNSKFWHIPVIDAVEWLLTRPNCPIWLKRYLKSHAQKSLLEKPPK